MQNGNLITGKILSAYECLNPTSASTHLENLHIHACYVLFRENVMVINEFVQEKGFWDHISCDGYKCQAFECVFGGNLFSW